MADFSVFSVIKNRHYSVKKKGLKGKEWNRIDHFRPIFVKKNCTKNCTEFRAVVKKGLIQSTFLKKRPLFLSVWHQLNFTLILAERVQKETNRLVCESQSTIVVEQGS